MYKVLSVLESESVPMDVGIPMRDLVLLESHLPKLLFCSLLSLSLHPWVGMKLAGLLFVRQEGGY